MSITVTNVCTLTETDVTTPNFHHLTLTQDIPAGVSLILAHLSSVDASDGGLTSAPSNIGGAAWTQDHVYHPGLDTSTVDVWRVNVVSPINHLTTTVDIPGTSRGLSTECVVYMVDGPGYVALDQSHDANNNFTTIHDSGLTATASAVDLLLIGLHGMNQNTIAWTPEVVSPTWTAVVQGNATIGYASAIQHRIVVGGGGTYKSRGTTGANCTSNDTIVAYRAASVGQSTGLGGVSLGQIATPDTRTGHQLHVRARKANPTETGYIRFWLYESNVLRSGPFDVALTDTFVTTNVAIPDGDAATIGSYGNLEVRFQGFGTGGAITPQMSFLELQTPGGSALSFGSSVFPAFGLGLDQSRMPPMFHPGAPFRQATAITYDQLLASISAGVAFPVEAVGAVTAALDDPIAASQDIAQTGVGQVEANTGIATTAAVPDEAAAGVSATTTDPVEAVQQLAQTAAAVYETPQGILVTSTVAADATGGIAATAAEILEALAGVTATSTEPLDELGQAVVTATAAFPIDAVQAVSQLAVTVEAIAQGITGTAGVALDELASIAALTGEIVDVLQQAATAAVEPVESVGLAAVSATGVFPIAISGGVAATAAASLDEIQPLSSAGTTGVEAVKSAAQTVLVVVNASKGVTAVAGTQQDVLQTLAAVAGFPIEEDFPAGFLQPGTIVVAEHGGVTLIVYETFAMVAAYGAGTYGGGPYGQGAGSGAGTVTVAESVGGSVLVESR